MKNFNEGKKIIEKLDLDEYDKKVRLTYRPPWHDSARKASRVLEKLK